MVMKDFFVVDAAKFDNAVVTSYFALSGLQVREKKQGGGQYLALRLVDKTGVLEARMWGTSRRRWSIAPRAAM